ncbi:MAG: hypothetical protein KC636_23370 [Myxococcales bacterium]|nr:hypothetical protein [Myxococcales bacterium]
MRATLRAGTIAWWSWALLCACATDSASSTGSTVHTPTASTDDAASSSATEDSTTASEPAAVSVLFVGNSYTAGNGLVDLLLALADPGTLDAEVITVGGETLGGHLATPATVDAIASGAWDMVVLQGQSVEPLLAEDGDFDEAALALAELVTSAGATPVFFETWARAAGDPLYAEPWYGPDPAAAQAKLRAAYQAVADASGGAVAPIGDAFERAWTEAPAIDLYALDGSHASLAGSYLAACVLLGALLDVDATGRSWPEGVAADDAATLQAIADALDEG